MVATKEGDGSSPQLEELLAAIHNNDQEAIELMLLRPEAPDVIRELAHKHWRLIEQIKLSRSPIHKEALMQKPEYGATMELVTTFPNMTANIVSELLKEDHGFFELVLPDQTDSDGAGNFAISMIYFEYMPYLPDGAKGDTYRYFNRRRELLDGLNLIEQIQTERKQILDDPSSLPGLKSMEIVTAELSGGGAW